jgi:hypothetical protein
MGKGYSSDDNRSMQLNDNNDRYYSSRGIDRDDLDWDYEEDDNNETGEIMLFEIGDKIINSQNISSVRVENCDVTFEIKKVVNDDYHYNYDEGYRSKKKVRMLSILVDVDAKIFMTDNCDGYSIAMYGNETEGVTENKYKRSEFGSSIAARYSQYFPRIDHRLLIKPRVICIDKRTDCDDVEVIKEKITFEILNSVNQFVIAFVNQSMQNQKG